MLVKLPALVLSKIIFHALPTSFFSFFKKHSCKSKSLQEKIFTSNNRKHCTLRNVLKKINFNGP